PPGSRPRSAAGRRRLDPPSPRRGSRPRRETSSPGEGRTRRARNASWQFSLSLSPRRAETVDRQSRLERSTAERRSPHGEAIQGAASVSRERRQRLSKQQTTPEP